MSEATNEIVAKGELTKELKVVHYTDLTPSWHPQGSDKPPHMRWVTMWVGGPEPYLHTDREKGAVTDSCAAGFFVLPFGMVQPHHSHTVDETYVVIKGRMAVDLPDGRTEVLGPLDCLFAPKGIPHRVRNCGTEDLHIIWFHAGIEEYFKTSYGT